MRITAALTETKGAPFTLAPLDLDDPRPGEVVVKMVSSGVCHTDLIVRDQWYPVPLPAVLGHEGAGVVAAVGGGVTSVGVGDHVVLTFNSCGGCRMCIQGRPAYCDQFFACNFAGSRPDGSTPLHRETGDVHGVFFGQSAFANYALATERNVVKVDPGAPLELLGPLGCGIQTGAGGVLNSLKPPAGSSIAVFGAGSVGLSAVMAAVVAGCTTIVAVDLNDQRLELAKEVGATHVINGAEGDTVALLRDLTSGLGVDYTLETTAVPAVLRQAVDALNQGGTCGLIGAAALGTEVALDMSSLLFGRSVRGIVEGDSVPHLFIPKLVDLYQQGRFPFDKLIKSYAFDDINQAVEDSEKGTTLKPVITFA
ncbi:NAD(P)-dependent alcohol dehydrogenase [Streptomyces fulvoviolaceus]|uniref:NAD(P)-dependent alcohol dehydrogenase n=1 Tax=Streptomyces fulvoviolaceus TaxID=285535 RepID=UPI0021C09686|nr:NAD(P)-dependent alcohol dehydrogenase [Streptomyces fulvoviolaceus]MCT9081840.1 NAD(P)-dependent alcohol dehydrogenase [Streptomyces fulvoviolaceus]